ncbi:Panacea domain-containing protein [Corynebacterium flavescens]
MTNRGIDVRDAAAYILSKYERPLSTMKLQKLLYFGQGWSLALLNRPLVDTVFQAWKWGPVSPDLYRHHARKRVMGTVEGGSAKRVDGNNKIILDAVVKNYGALSGMQLGDLTHLPGTPWTICREKAGVLDKSKPSRVEIPDDDIKTYFKETLPTVPRHRLSQTKAPM